MRTNTKIVVALIGGGATIAAAAVAGVFILFRADPRSSHEAITRGANSPAVISQGDVNITYGVPQVIVDGWQRSFSNQSLTQHEVAQRLNELADEQRQLRTMLQERASTEPVSQDAFRYVSTRNFGRAADILIMDLTRRLEASDFAAAAARAEELSRLRKLQLEPVQAQNYQSMASDLRRRARETASPSSASSLPTAESSSPRDPTARRGDSYIVVAPPGATRPVTSAFSASGEPLAGTTGEAAGDRWQVSWLDLIVPMSFRKGERLLIKVEGNAETVLLRLLPNGSSPASRDGIEGPTHKVLGGGVLDVRLERDHPNVKQISVHAGKEALGTPLGPTNGTVKLVSIDRTRQ